MKEIYIILSLDENGQTSVMRDFYSTKEYALEAVKRYDAEKGDRKVLFYYTVGNLVK